MRLSVIAAGRIRSGPERALVDDYRTRAEAAGRNIGLAPVDEVEFEPKKTDKDSVSSALLERGAYAGVKVVLDERGRALSSEDFAAKLASWRDTGVRETAFFIGGADGFSRDARAQADLVLALGPQTWPHKLARVMVFEQIYRAIAILAGSPYHRA